LLGEIRKPKCLITEEADIEILGNTTKTGTEHSTDRVIVKTKLRATKGGDQEKFFGARIMRGGHMVEEVALDFF
jgi:hypothetical protein